MTPIRPATPSDIPLIRDLIHELATYEREPHSVEITEDQLLRDGFGPERYYECLIAKQDGEPAGFALFFPIYSTWRGRSLHLEDLFVRPRFHGHGIGKALLLRVAAIAVERGCARLQWDVLSWNQPAIDFYLSLDAVMLDDWRRMRVTDNALTALASAGTGTEAKV
ncbi:MAG TPA: GNAT family N-acetyltransferase [Silvibacterium sp.]|jgi:GNAT superfamily N-acetyltransferase|nr:GNAT family N-acetyltransferase [Silvibacterium sp.]